MIGCKWINLLRWKLLLRDTINFRDLSKWKCISLHKLLEFSVLVIQLIPESLQTLQIQGNLRMKNYQKDVKTRDYVCLYLTT